MSKTRKTPGINGTSSADIAFMLLIFFLITTSMDTDRGLARRLPPPVPKDQKEEIDVKERNFIKVLINSEGLVLFEGKLLDIAQLKDKVKEYVENASNADDMPEKLEEEVPLFGKVMITKNHVISLMNHRTTSYQDYISVQNELAKAYNELRNELARKKFGKPFEELETEQQKAVAKVYPQKISEAEPKNYGEIK